MTAGTQAASQAETISEIDVYGELRRACRLAGGQATWAAAHGLTQQHVCDVLAARRQISDRVLAALGLRRVVRYARTRSPNGGPH